MNKIKYIGTVALTSFYAFCAFSYANMENFAVLVAGIVLL